MPHKINSKFCFHCFSATVFILALLLIFTAIDKPCFAQDNDSYTDELVQETAKRVMADAPAPGVASIGGEWAVIGIKQSGLTLSQDFYNGYLSRVKSTFDYANGDLGRKYTEYSRIATAVNLVGGDVRDIGDGRYDLLSYINDYDNVTRQGINGPIFALSAKYFCGDTDTETANKYISYILRLQNYDGSFGLSQGVADVDITAMTIASLSLYRNGNPAVYDCVNRAFLYLSTVQQASGGFGVDPNDEDFTESCETTAQVIIAMKRYGLNPKDGFFTKNGKTPMDALKTYRTNNGGYKHVLTDSDDNQMATEQALLALTEPQGNPSSLVYDNMWFGAAQLCSTN